MLSLSIEGKRQSFSLCEKFVSKFFFRFCLHVSIQSFFVVVIIFSFCKSEKCHFTEQCDRLEETLVIIMKTLGNIKYLSIVPGQTTPFFQVIGNSPASRQKNCTHTGSY